MPPERVLEKVRIPCVQRAAFTALGRTEPLFVVDLGLHGVFVERGEPLPAGATVDITFPLPGNEIPVRAACRVAWWNPPVDGAAPRSLPPGLGLEFVEMSDADRDRVRRHVVEFLQTNTHLRRFAPHRETEDPRP